jgi:hypothetical protein
MKSKIHLSIIYLSFLINKKTFVYALIFLVILSLFLIPNKNSDYITFYIGKYTGESNTYWVSNLGAIFTNLILSFVCFFFVEGTYTFEKNEGVGVINRVTPASNFILLLHKWLAYLLILFILMLVIIISLYFINYKDSNFFVFLKPFFYFTVPYIFILSLIILFFDTFINIRVLKITFFIIFILFLCIPLNNKNTDLLGFNEFTINAKSQLLKKYNIQDQSYAIGYIKKTKALKYLDLADSSKRTNTYLKILYIPISIIALYFCSFLFGRFRSKKLKVKQIEIKNYIENSQVLKRQNYILKENIISKKFISILTAYFIIFISTFNLKQILFISFFYIISFFVGYQIASHFIIPMVFLISFDKYDKFINIDNNENIKFIFNTSLYSTNEKLIAKTTILFIYFFMCAFPILILNLANIQPILNILFLSIFSVIFNYIFKNIKLLEILYVLIFASYISGHPIINIF